MFSSQSTSLLPPFLPRLCDIIPASVPFYFTPISQLPSFIFFNSPPYISPCSRRVHESYKYSVFLRGWWLYLDVSQILEIDNAASVSMGISSDEKINVGNTAGFYLSHILWEITTGQSLFQPLLAVKSQCNWQQASSIPLCHSRIWKNLSMLLSSVDLTTVMVSSQVSLKNILESCSWFRTLLLESSLTLRKWITSLLFWSLYTGFLCVKELISKYCCWFIKLWMV